MDGGRREEAEGLKCLTKVAKLEWEIFMEYRCKLSTIFIWMSFYISWSEDSMMYAIKGSTRALTCFRL